MIPALRDYQAGGLEQLRKLAAQGKRFLLLISPTGSGKTVTFAAAIRSSVSLGRRAIVIAHRKELIDQTVKKLEDFGVRAGVIMGQDARRDSRLAVQVCSIQTLTRRIDRLPPADLVVVDEAHHALSNSYRDVLARYDRALVLGATATPWRSDKLGLADLFEASVVAATPRELILSGSLVGYEPFAYDAPDLHSVGVVAGEYNQRQLGLACNTDVLVSDIVREYSEHAAGRPALVFPVGVESSRRIVERFRDEGFAAEHLDCHTPKAERERIIDGLRTRRVTVVSSVGVLTEGFDAPAAEVCILARPTLSLTLYMQMVGRVLRPHPGKQGALIHDHAGNLLRHGFPDDDRDYSLEATEQRVVERHCCPFCRVVYSQRRDDGTCPKCGQLIALAEQAGADRRARGGGEPPKKREVEGVRLNREQIEALRAQLKRPDLTDAEAQRVGTASPRQKAAEWLRLRELAARKGWPESWAEKAYSKTFGVMPGFSDEFLAHVRPAPRPFVTPRKRSEANDAA